MKDIKKPEFLKNTANGKNRTAFLEVLIALLLYFIGTIFMMVVQMPATVIYLLTNEEYLAMLKNNSFDFERIMQIVLNLPPWLTVVSLVSQIVLIIVFILYCRLFEKRKANTLGFRKKGLLAEYAKGIILGAVMYVAVYGICLLTGSVRFSQDSVEGTTGLYLIAFFIGYMIQGMAEEVICRGYLISALGRRCSVMMSIVISSLFFSMLHGVNSGIGFLAYVNLFLFGMFMGLLFVRFENIWLVGAIHSVWNFMQGNVFGIQVSGNPIQPSLFSTEFVERRTFINGGSFGSEGGIAVTLVLLAATAILLWEMSKRGYIVETKSVTPYVKQAQNEGYYEKLRNQQAQDAKYEQNVQNNKNAGLHENMGMNPEETPWHPQTENQEENVMTGFDKNYFKD